VEHFNRSHYNLNEIQELLKHHHTRIITVSAVKTALELGFGNENVIVDKVLELRACDIHKTMTNTYNHRLWQDVYISADDIYIKLQITNDKKGAIISFKKNEGS
jgi:hypothetical protein